MKLPTTLSTYLARQFFIHLIIILLGLMFLTMLFDLVELLRRAASKPDVTFSLILKMSSLRLPFILQQLSPFAILFATLSTFWRLGAHLEIIVAKASGASIWQLVFPFIGGAFLAAVLEILLINPLSSALLTKLELLDHHYFKKETSLLTVSTTGLWFQYQKGSDLILINASRLNIPERKVYDPTLFIFENYKYRERLSAKEGTLYKDYWSLNNATNTRLGKPSTYHATRYIALDLPLERLQESFASPETLSIFKLPEFIKVLEQSGFPGKHHILYFYSLLARPFLFIAMVLIAASLSFWIPRQRRATFFILSGISAGFLLFFINNITYALGLSSTVPLFLAAWVPAIIFILLGITTLLHFEGS